MEKPVEIVEKCEFSTAIPAFSNSLTREREGIFPCISEYYPQKGKIMSPQEPVCYWQKEGEKVEKTAKPIKGKGWVF